VVGDLAIVRLAGFGARDRRRIGEALLEEVKNLKGVFEQEGGIEGEFRLRPLRHVAGVQRTLTTHRENGCAFRVDVAKCYFSPRLSTERLRIARLARRGEKVLNMFAGVGPFSIPVAKMAGAKVTSWEINGYACELHRENDMANGVGRLVRVVEGDAMGLAASTRARFDRILMPHPSASDRFLPAAAKLARPRAVIHYYRHVLGTDEGEASRNLGMELDALLPRGASYTARRVREVGPRWVEMAADVKLGA
jgi:tRNA (guanine37-N1)-methyltransferase